MSNKIKNADLTATPHHVQSKPNSFGGLTKREMFAMHSMQAILSGNSLRELGDIAKENGLDNADSLLVEMSISAADALLAELDK